MALRNIKYKKHHDKFTEPLKLFSLDIFISLDKEAIEKYRERQKKYVDDNQGKKIR